LEELSELKSCLEELSELKSCLGVNGQSELLKVVNLIFFSKKRKDYNNSLGLLNKIKGLWQPA